MQRKLIVTAWLGLLLGVSTCQAANSNIALNDGELIRAGHQLVEATFDAEQNIALNDVNVRLAYQGTVQPKQVAATIASLGQLRTLNHHHLQMTSVSQKTTSTGLIDVSASLSVVVPLRDLSQVYQLAKEKSSSGVSMIVSAVSPYLSIEDKEDARQQLSTDLYEQINEYVTVLNKLTNKNYRIARVEFNGLMPADQLKTYRPNVMLATSRTADTAVDMQQKFTMNARVLFVSQ